MKSDQEILNILEEWNKSTSEFLTKKLSNETQARHDSEWDEILVFALDDQKSVQFVLEKHQEIKSNIKKFENNKQELSPYNSFNKDNKVIIEEYGYHILEDGYNIQIGEVPLLLEVGEAPLLSEMEPLYINHFRSVSASMPMLLSRLTSQEPQGVWAYASPSLNFFESKRIPIKSTCIPLSHPFSFIDEDEPTIKSHAFWDTFYNITPLCSVEIENISPSITKELDNPNKITNLQCKIIS